MKIPPPPNRLLIARNDKLGDFILALPCFEAVRERWPDAELAAYLPEYTREIAGMCPAIDRVVIDPQLEKLRTIRRVTHELRDDRFDVLVTLRSFWNVNIPGFLARIPLRIGPRTNVYSAFLTHTVRQRRSASTKPEWDYNLDLVRFLFGLFDVSPDVELHRPVISLDADRVVRNRRWLLERYSLDPGKAVVIVHPGQSGTTNNLRPEQYAELIGHLRSCRGHSVILTAGPGEIELVREVSARLGATPHVVHESTRGLRAFAELLANADLFIASSTGTLHLAGALDRPTAGFFERRRTKGSLRWQTLNSPGRRLGFEPPEDADERDVQATDVRRAAQQINEHFLLDENRRFA